DEPGDPRPRMEDVALAIERINAVTDLDIRTVNSQWTGLRTFAPDGELVIGEDPEQRGFYWLVGLGGIGIATSPAYGSLLASLVTDTGLAPELREAGVEPKLLSPARFRETVAGLPPGREETKGRWRDPRHRLFASRRTEGRWHQ